MIIAMSSLQEIHRQVAGLSKLYNDKEVYKYDEDNSLDYSGGQRLTFIGHANTYTYGEKNVYPADFAKHLIAHGLPKDQEVIIDLLGCSIGDMSSGESFAIQLGKELYQEGFNNVRINALNSLVTNKPEEYAKTFMIAHHLTGSGKVLEAKLDAVNKADEMAFNNDYESENQEYAIRKHAKIVYKTNDIRNALDNNANFQVTPETVNLHYERRKLLMFINNRIADLKDEIKNSSVRKLTGYSSKVQQTKINELTKLKKQLEAASLDAIPNIISSALSNDKMASGRTLKTLLDTQQQAKSYIAAANNFYSQGESIRSIALKKYYFTNAATLGHVAAQQWLDDQAIGANLKDNLNNTNVNSTSMIIQTFSSNNNANPALISKSNEHDSYSENLKNDLGFNNVTHKEVDQALDNQVPDSNSESSSSLSESPTRQKI